MRMKLAALFLVALSLACATSSAPHYAGRRFVFKYASGLEVEVFYPSATELQWKALTGPAAGTSGTEHTHVVEMGRGQYFINWVEANGTTVSNVLDLTRMKVTAFVTWPADSGRQGHADEGTVREIWSAAAKPPLS